MTAKKTDDPSVPHVYVAINEVTAALSRDGITKARANTQQGYNFRGIDDVYNALSGPLSTAKLLMLPRVLARSVAERETKSGGRLCYVVLDVEFDFVSAVDGSKHTIRTMGEAMDSADKATNKAMSAAMKYACLMAFQIPTEGDNDADASHHELASKLHESIDWTKWRTKHAESLHSAASLPDLREEWAAVFTDAEKVRAPKEHLDWLTREKDAAKTLLEKPKNGAQA